MSAVINAIEATYLRPIDREGLLKLAEAGKSNPEKRGTIKVKSEMKGVFRSWNYVGLHNPVIVDEPPHLLGENTAPAPGEILLSALGGCLGVGITAVATAREVKLSKLDVYVEGDIGNSATWGADGAEREAHQMGFQAVRVKVDIEGDASPSDLEKIIQHANFYSPIANSFRNPIAFEIGLNSVASISSATEAVTFLRPIDREGLLKLAAGGKANPEKRGTIEVKSEMKGVFRSWNYVGLHNPVIVDEPPHLLGENTAPAPGEILLSALGGCLGVGITAVATAREVKLSKLDVYVEGDIGNSATWGADGAEREAHQMGFQAVRVKVDIEGDASPSDLEKIVQHANFYSPIANSFRNPIAFEILSS